MVRDLRDSLKSLFVIAIGSGVLIEVAINIH
jgi:hypothetical protein